MKTRLQKTNLALLLLCAIAWSSCVNLQHVNNFSSSALESVRQFEAIPYGFRQACIDRCTDEKIQQGKIDVDKCPCTADAQADSVTLILYNAVAAYFEGLVRISDNELTEYKTAAIGHALAGQQIGSITLQKEQVDACSGIANILLRACTDEYRKSNIKDYVKTANAPLQTIIGWLDFNLSNNLMGMTENQEIRVKNYYSDYLRNPSLPANEKLVASNAYAQRLQAIEQTKSLLLSYSKALKEVAEGHQALSEQIDKVKSDEVKILLADYSGKIHAVMAEFNKLKF